MLIKHFKQLDGLTPEFSDDAKGMLMNYAWPGNVRELRNVLNRLSFLYPNTIIGVQQVYNATGKMFHLVELPDYRNQTDPLPQPTMPKYGDAASVPQTASSNSKATEISDVFDDEVRTMQEYEKMIIQKAIATADGNLVNAADMLGISRATIYNKVKKYGL